MLEVSPAAIKKWILADEFERFQKTHGFGTGTGEPLRVLVVDDQRDVADVIVIRPDGFLSKPFTADSVRGLLARLFGPRR